MKLSITPQDSNYWDFRKDKIGASDAPIIMNVSKWKTPHQLWLEKLSIDEKRFISPQMERGINMEEIALHQANIDLGMIFERFHVHAHDIYCDMMIASLDGYNEENQVILEIKCPGKVDHDIAKGGKIPDHYYPQLQHQLACVKDAKYAIYYSFDGEEGISVKVERNDQYIAYMIEKEKDFFKHLQNLTAPPSKENEFVSFEDNDEWSDLATEYFTLLEKIDMMKKHIDQKKQMLINLSHQKNAQGAGLILQKVVKKGSIKYDAIPELKNIDLESYRDSPVEYWKIKRSKNV